jgi:hypothetical protein
MIIANVANCEELKNGLGTTSKVTSMAQVRLLLNLKSHCLKNSKIFSLTKNLLFPGPHL